MEVEWTSLGVGSYREPKLYLVGTSSRSPLFNLTISRPSARKRRPERVEGYEFLEISNGQTSITPWATAQGDSEASSIAAPRSAASIKPKPAIGKSAFR